ncbi:hypothetical protein H257_01674 [Aphanomyces astaci]|uniref:Uncharacterized protein n=1 Tax=Aphanomyces astaci TaxID=112090 RepID=W4H3L2_APHAT|nr:hypothetical protein H257_01674 [Aphanomyces astaci]ETV86492.1 hypothetical protein H257_01674 [Aphanomyces astaci]|eukprot:XP_009823291.1 hypothetical protein H257_01674 [Aphanomyces astaci]
MLEDSECGPICPQGLCSSLVSFAVGPRVCGWLHLPDKSGGRSKRPLATTNDAASSSALAEGHGGEPCLAM